MPRDAREQPAEKRNSCLYSGTEAKDAKWQLMNQAVNPNYYTGLIS